MWNFNCFSAAFGLRYFAMSENAPSMFLRSTSVGRRRLHLVVEIVMYRQEFRCAEVLLESGGPKRNEFLAGVDDLVLQISEFIGLVPDLGVQGSLAGDSRFLQDLRQQCSQLLFQSGDLLVPGGLVRVSLCHFGQHHLEFAPAGKAPRCSIAIATLCSLEGHRATADCE
jgi:hypothetical protein